MAQCWGHYAKVVLRHQGALPVIWSRPAPQASSSCVCSPSWAYLAFPGRAAGRPGVWYAARCRAVISGGFLSVSGRARPAAGGRLGLVVAAIWVMGARSQALGSPSSPRFSLTDVSEARWEGPQFYGQNDQHLERGWEQGSQDSLVPERPSDHTTSPVGSRPEPPCHG